MCFTFAKKMNALRIGLLAVSISNLVGCTLTADKTTHCCANYERPDFVISFFPESLQRKEPIVDISEDSNGPVIRVNWSQEQYRITDTSGYHRLKKRILTSTQWEKRVSESILPGVFTGSPRDILTVRSGDKGICLQGADVPRGWREELIRLASSTKGTKIQGEQAAPSNR
jgi:hypothetical protein